MFRKMTVAMVTVFLGAGGLLTSLSYGMAEGQLIAHNEHGKKKAAKGASTSELAKSAEPAEHLTCPVSGEKIEENSKIAYEYKGKIYSFCCEDCSNAFKKDPEKYIAKKGEEAAGTNGQEPAHGDHH